VEAATGTVAPPAFGGAGRRPADSPRRANGLELIGAMPGSGYREAPALARRGDGQVIKLTGLLYELVDSIDGNRNYDELAAELTRRVGKRATARDVRYLVEQKLRPLGVLSEPDGTQPVLRKANPLLALRLRAILSKPELTRRLTTPFVWLFSPPVVIPVLTGFAALCWWLITDKGLASPIHQAFYDPVMILVVWGLMIVGAAFHELGHASACRYGGARPGVMGAGIYLAWPVFYTEVSDAYRLDRGGRLRVDLGGLYFNAIFALVAAGISLLTGVDAVLLVIVMLLAQMVRQLAPFIRADGYHIVADLTGVPDLFAHIKPTLLGLLPTRWGRGGHSRLKPWARVLVSAWVLLVVPVLAGMLGYMVLVLPRLAATAWDSMGIEWAAATASWHDGDPVATVVSVFSAGLVALPVLGVIYMLGRFARRTARRTWTATAERPVLRTWALLAAAGLIALIGWAWLPSDRYQPIRAEEPGALPAVAPGAPLAVTGLQTVSATQPIHAGSMTTGPAVPDSQPPATAPRTPAASPRTADGAYPPASSSPGGSESRPAWPFPFDPPEAPRPGDNQAVAVNTHDNSTVLNIALDLLVLAGGGPVDETNEADALASCQACTTVAVAFQVILIVGYVDEITPENGAIAINYQCNTCTTAAFAYQIVASLPQTPSPELLQQLTTILQQLQDLEANRDSLTLDQIYLALKQVERDVLNALADNASTDANSTSAGADGQQAQDAAPAAPNAPPNLTAPAPPPEPSPTTTSPDPSVSPAEPTQTTQTTQTTTEPSTTACDPATDPQCGTSTEPAPSPAPDPAPTP
jgi:putative peptide zinc metalloprotease protein